MCTRQKQEATDASQPASQPARKQAARLVGSQADRQQRTVVRHDLICRSQSAPQLIEFIVQMDPQRLEDQLRRVETLRENGTFFEFSLCSSRACLGKIMHFIYKWLKKCRFLT
jgi:hypothetical protein